MRSRRYSVRLKAKYNFLRTARINQKALEYIFVREVIADMKTTFQNGRVLLNKSEKEIQERES